MTRRLGPLVLLALSLTACGSTVQVTSTSQPLGGDGLGGRTGSLSGASGAGGSISSPVATSGTTGGSTGGTATTGRVEAGTAGGQTTAPGRTPTSVARGVASREPIRVGVIHSPGVDKAAAAFGISGLTTGDTKAQFDAVVGWIRAHGGLGGRPIATFDHEIDLQQSADNPDLAYEKACVAMKEDHKVRFVVTILNLRPGSMPCFAKAGIGVLDDQTGVSQSVMERYSDFLANPGELANERLVGLLVDDLVARGWLTSASKIGSFAYDTPELRSLVDRQLVQALAEHGLTVTSKQYVSNSASSINEASGTALKFRSAGVDRVIPLGASPLFLMNAASSQGYRPWYAMHSAFGPGALLEGAAPKDQLANSAGIGWQPYLDIGKGAKPGPVSTRETLCFQIMKAAGQASTSVTTKGFQLQVCNTLFYLKDAADRVPSVPRDLLSLARPLLGGTFVSADTFRTDVTNRTDGVAGFRSLAFREDCSCYQYVSPVKGTP